MVESRTAHISAAETKYLGVITHNVSCSACLFSAPGPDPGKLFLPPIPADRISYAGARCAAGSGHVHRVIGGRGAQRLVR